MQVNDSGDTCPGGVWGGGGRFVTVLHAQQTTKYGLLFWNITIRCITFSGPATQLAKRYTSLF